MALPKTLPTSLPSSTSWSMILITCAFFTASCKFSNTCKAANGRFCSVMYVATAASASAPFSSTFTFFPPPAAAPADADPAEAPNAGLAAAAALGSAVFRFLSEGAAAAFDAAALDAPGLLGAALEAAFFGAAALLGFALAPFLPFLPASSSSAGGGELQGQTRSKGVRGEQIEGWKGVVLEGGKEESGHTRVVNVRLRLGLSLGFSLGFRRLEFRARLLLGLLRASTVLGKRESRKMGQSDNAWGGKWRICATDEWEAERAEGVWRTHVRKQPTHLFVRHRVVTGSLGWAGRDRKWTQRGVRKGEP